MHNIPRYSQILVDAPLIMMRPDEDLPELYLRFNGLSQAEKGVYLALSQRNDPARHAMLKDKLLHRGFEITELQQMANVANIMQTNAFNVDFGDTLGPNHRALFPAVARINHSCAPNAHVCFYPPDIGKPKGAMVVHSLQPIDIGIEVVISYFNVVLPRSERQRKARKWGFECACSVCTAPGADPVRESLQIFTAQQEKMAGTRQGSIGDINAAVQKGLALATQIETGLDLVPALPQLFDALGALQGKKLYVRYSDEERDHALSAYEHSASWEARITGHESPATAKRLKKLKAFAARWDVVLAPRFVWRLNHGFVLKSEP